MAFSRRIFLRHAAHSLAALGLAGPTLGWAQGRGEGAENSVTVRLDAEGRFFLDDAPVSIKALRAALVRVAKDNPDTAVFIHADRRVVYQRVVQVMEAAKQAGLSQISFVADEDQESVPSELHIHVAANGKVSLDGTPMRLEDLSAALQRVAQDNPDAAVRVEGDRRTQYARVVEVMNIAQRAGLSRIGLVQAPDPMATKP